MFHRMRDGPTSRGRYKAKGISGMARPGIRDNADCRRSEIVSENQFQAPAIRERKGGHGSRRAHAEVGVA